MEQFNTIPTSGNWADIAGILDANFLRCWTALVQSESLIGLDGSNFKGIFTSADALPEMTEPGWALVGTSLSALKLYVYNGGSTDWALLNDTTYNFTNFTEFQSELDALSSQVDQIGSDLDELETTLNGGNIPLSVTWTDGFIYNGGASTNPALQRTELNLTKGQTITFKGGKDSSLDVYAIAKKVETNYTKIQSYAQNAVQETIVYTAPENMTIVISSGKTFTDGVVSEVVVGKIKEIEDRLESKIFDVSANNDGATFASLSELLLNANLSTLIPIAVRSGGMSIRFVQTSDNKYVQYRLMADEWSADTDDWAIAEEGVYVENPEFIYVKTDAEDKILYGVKQNCDFYFGAGVPSQVQEELDNKVAEFAEFADNKVDKEEGKSLIDSDYASSQSVIENPDFIEVKTDSEGRILEDITSDGRKEINIPVDMPSASFESVDNPEYIKAETDEEGRVISSRKVDGTLVEKVGIETKSLYAEELNLPDEEINTLRDEMINDKGLDYVHEYPCVRDAAKDGQTGVIKVGSELYASVVDNPSELTHKQDAYANPYYDANSTLNQYTTIGSRIAIPENICNRAEQEEIDFTPSETGKTRIIVGKSSNDVFFVSRVNCDYGEGVPDTTSRENCLETTTDFVTFTPIFRAHNSETIQTGLYISGYGGISIKSVKEFANGDFIVAGNCWYDGSSKTCFFILKSDFSAITPINCTYLDGTIGLMMDEFDNNVYDWHISISGSKALVSTYGSRQPETDYGRVWYTEDNGVTWKQIFQMTNHYQDGVSPDDPPVTKVHTHGVMIDEYDDKLYVIAGEANANLFWSDKGWNTTDNDWNVISIKRDLPLQHQSYMQVVNGYAFATNLIFGSDCGGAGAIYRLNKLGKNSYSKIQVAHEFLPNKVPSTMYCGAGMYRRDNHSPLFFCETRENCMPTEEQNEILEQYHKARVVATYDGINFTEIWTDDTFGTHETYISSEGVTTRKFSYCGRDMNFYLLKNGDAVIKYIGRNFNYFGGTPMYSVQGNTKGCCKVRWIKNVGRYL